MKSIDSIGIDINAELKVSESTARGCLALVEMYMNQEDVGIICDRRDDGTMTLNFADYARYCND